VAEAQVVIDRAAGKVAEDERALPLMQEELNDKNHQSQAKLGEE
jgi:hypothetical protein